MGGCEKGCLFLCFGGEGVVGIVNDPVLPYQFMH